MLDAAASGWHTCPQAAPGPRPMPKVLHHPAGGMTLTAKREAAFPETTSVLNIP